MEGVVIFRVYPSLGLSQILFAKTRQERERTFPHDFQREIKGSAMKSVLNLFKMNKIKTFSIHLDQDSQRIYPGQAVSGHILLAFDGPQAIKSKGIQVGVRGFVKTHWTTEHSGQDENGDTYSWTEQHGKEEQVLGTKSHVFGDGKTNQLIEPTFEKDPHRYPFKFYLPLDIPPSMAFKHGNISYIIEATLQRSWMMDKKAENKKFIVEDVSNLQLIPGAEVINLI